MNRLLLLDAQIGKLLLGHRRNVVNNLDLRDRTIGVVIVFNGASATIPLFETLDALHGGHLLGLLLLTTEFLEMVHLVFATDNPELLVFAHALIEDLDFLLELNKVEILGLLLHLLERIDQLLKLLNVKMIKVFQLLLMRVQELMLENEED